MKNSIYQSRIISINIKIKEELLSGIDKIQNNSLKLEEEINDKDSNNIDKKIIYKYEIKDIEKIKQSLALNCVNGAPLVPVGTWMPKTTTKENKDFENTKIKQ